MSTPTSPPHDATHVEQPKVSSLKKFAAGSRGVIRAYPSATRIVSITLLTFLAILATFYISDTQNPAIGEGAAVAVAVLGLTWLTGWSGQVSLGNSGFMMVGAYTASLWINHHPSATQPSSYGIGLVLAVAVGAVTGLILGLPATRLRGPYLAGMTIAFAVVIPSFIQTLSFAGGSGGLQVFALTPPQWFVNFFNDQEYGYQIANAQWPTDIVIAIAGFSFLIMANLFHSKLGRSMRMVRDNDVAAELAGINLPRMRALAFVISASFGALGGALFIYIANTITPEEPFQFTFGITLLTLMVVGGIGTLWGAAIAGVVFAYQGPWIAWLSSHVGISSTTNLGQQMPNILFSGILILTMLLAPRGIVGGIQDLVRIVKKLLASSDSRSETSPESPSDNASGDAATHSPS